ncbi:uncharacterized protein LOC121404949 [Drosophila obscura]|uniref:uncharacterized protein LOC121404949 n=1 Tax=Drosophila obscura TaxID=7282 RepID=UPI001BB24D2D|nr:uncharacterized protein LOC121404949 [Drosophila obscura]
MRGLEATYRICAIRITCSFRTILDEAALVIAGQIPLGELIRERKDIHDATHDREAAHTVAELKVAARRSSLENWQASVLGQVDFYLTQALSGHGCFRSYLKRFGHETEDWCPECGTGIVEDAQHVLFECHRFGYERQELEATAGARISAETLVPLMLAEPRVWEAAAVFACSVMRTLRSLERSCTSCQKFQAQQRKPVVKMIIRKAEEPFATLCADFVGPLPRSKKENTMLLAFHDTFTKWVELVPDTQPLRSSETICV